MWQIANGEEQRRRASLNRNDQRGQTLTSCSRVVRGRGSPRPIRSGARLGQCYGMLECGIGPALLSVKSKFAAEGKDAWAFLTLLSARAA
jgi:hypothetical protein